MPLSCSCRVAPPACRLRREASAAWLLRFGAQQCQVAEGRQAGRAPFGQRLLGEGKIALVGQLHQQRMIGQVRLNDHLAGSSARPARPATCTIS